MLLDWLLKEVRNKANLTGCSAVLLQTLHTAQDFHTFALGTGVCAQHGDLLLHLESVCTLFEDDRGAHYCHPARSEPGIPCMQKLGGGLKGIR